MRLTPTNSGSVPGQSFQKHDLEEHCDLLLHVASVLHTNGQETGETLDAVKRIASVWDIEAELFPAWGKLSVQVSNNSGTALRMTSATPSSVGMNRVSNTMKTVEEICSKQTSAQEANAALKIKNRLPPSNIYLFVLACSSGAVALALIFGAVHPEAFGVIAISAAIGALIRRTLAHFGVGSFVQVLSAALIAGYIGSWAVHWQISSALRLVAVCPCMILVPGPHILNGAFDLAEMRISLGASRLGFAALTVLAICTGLLIGLSLGGESLAVSESGRQVSLWFDAIAAGIAAVSYGIFFSMPVRMLIWPLLTGMIANAGRWMAISVWGLSAVAGTGVACLIVGALLVPISNRFRLPFAAVGFASVVSLMPGVFLFRMSSGLAQIQKDTVSLLVATFSDGMTALLIVMVMTVGLILPMHIFSRLRRKPVLKH